MSNHNREKGRQHTSSNFNPRSKVSEHNDTSFNYHNAKFQESFYRPLSIRPKKRNKKCVNRLYITPQFSINITCNIN